MEISPITIVVCDNSAKPEAILSKINAVEIPFMPNAVKRCRRFCKVASEYPNNILFEYPESGLHPSRHLTLAYILAKCAKKKRTNVIIKTHSPYIIRGLEIITEFLEIKDTLKLYKVNGEEFIDCTKDREKIYADFADPFQKIEDLDWETDLDEEHLCLTLNREMLNTDI